jgi:selenide,water dikinase
LAPGELSHAIGALKSSNENLIIGMEASNEDASVYKIDDEKALVQTVDYITPVVDDPYIYGQVAAANSLSDVFAMGADVATALNLVGFDGCHHKPEILAEILQGGLSKVSECGGIVVGGHTIDTPEMTYGLSVAGFVHPQKIYRNNTLRVGDVLVLTKPIGMGVLTTGIKADMLAEHAVIKTANILAQLNYKASLIMREFDVSACTDVTGFGLAGHAYEMSGKNFTIEFDFEAIPIIKEAIDLANMGIIPAGTYNNKAYLDLHVEIKKDYNEEIFFYDAQTSGGLLIAVSEKDAPVLLKRLRDEGYEYSEIIANVKEFSGKSLVLK